MLVPLILYAMLIPGAVAALVFVALGQPWREPARGRAAVMGPAIALGFLASYWGIAGSPAAVPVDVADWLPHIAAAAALASAIETALASRAARWVARAAVSFGAAWLLFLPPGSDASPDMAEAVLAIAGSGLALMACWHLLAQSAADPGEHRLVGAALAILVAGSAAAAVAASGSLKVGQLAGAVAAGCGALFAAMLLFARAPRLDSAAGVIASITGSALILGLVYSELPTPSLALVALALPAYALIRNLTHGRLSARLATAVRLGLVAALVAVAVGLAAMPPSGESSDSSDDSYDYDYGY